MSISAEPVGSVLQVDQRAVETASDAAASVGSRLMAIKFLEELTVACTPDDWPPQMLVTPAQVPGDLATPALEWVASIFRDQLPFAVFVHRHSMPHRAHPRVRKPSCPSMEFANFVLPDHCRHATGWHWSADSCALDLSFSTCGKAGHQLEHCQ